MDVHQHHIGAERFGQGNCLSAARGAADHFDALLDREREHQRFGEERVIVDDEHANRDISPAVDCSEMSCHGR